jgi:hypothetical protein
MKLLRSNGRILEIYDIGPVLMRISAINLPLKENGLHIVSDDQVREKVSDLIDSDLYDVRSFRNT